MDTALTTQQPAQIQQSAPTPTPMAMIQVAFQKALDAGGAEALAVADRILEQMAKQRDYDDRQAYNSALQRIQSKLGVVVKDKSVTGKGKYASSKAVDKAILAACREENFIFSFDSEDSGNSDVLKLVCDCSINGSAYVHRYRLPLPLSGSGAKGGGVMNITDAACAAVTKGKRYLKNMVFNLRIEETDDEEAGNSTSMGADASDSWKSAIEGSGNIDELQKNYIGALKAAAQAGDKAIISTFDKAKSATYRQIMGAK